MPSHHHTNVRSTMMRVLANMRFPGPLQRTFTRIYIRSMKVDMTGFPPPESFRTLNEFFTRMPLVPRAIDPDPQVLISPCDARITAQGILARDMALQIKGMPYSIRECLTGHARQMEECYDGDFATFYLSPSDYHHYHAPCDLTVRRIVHAPGTLYAVNRASATSRPGLFHRNERVVMECDTPWGWPLYLVLVGALNVGDMVISFDPRIETNRATTMQCYDYDGVPLQKGERIGYFKMGSTVLLFCPRGRVRLMTALGQKLRFGDPVAERVDPPTPEEPA